MQLQRLGEKLTGVATNLAIGTAGTALAARRYWQHRGLRFSVVVMAAGLVLVVVISALLLTMAAEPAYAQDDAIRGTLANVRDYIAGTLLILGGIGFVVSLGLKAASPINENAQYLANYGMKSSIIAVLAGAIVNPVMQIIQGLAAGGGGG